MGEKELEEISIRELIKIFYKHRKLIAAFVTVSVLISVSYAFLLATPMYSAQSEIDVKGIATGVVSLDNTNTSQIITNELLKSVNNSQLMERTSKLLSSNDIMIDKAALSTILSVSAGADGKSVAISAKYKEKKTVAQIANAFADAVREYYTYYPIEKIQKQMIIAETQLKLAETNTEEELSSYREYISRPDSIGNLQSQLDINKDLLILLKANLLGKNIGEGKGISQIENDIVKLEEENQVLNEKLVEESYKDRLIKRELDFSIARYESLSDEYNKLRYAKIYYKDTSMVNILASAVEPAGATSPNRKLIVLISLVASICVGAFIAFMIEYYKSWVRG